MATDYDALRQSDTEESGGDLLEELKARRADTRSGSVDADDDAITEISLPAGVDLSTLSNEDLTVRVLPKQGDEFTCASCFLVQHRSRLVPRGRGREICADCA